MFKNIQKSLLIKYPLLWNTKIVPLFCIMLVFHIIFFIIGYLGGGIDFSEIGNPFGFNFDKEVVVFFSILTSVLSMIIWLVFYFKNNSFKSFYPKGKFSLYKEWLIQFVASVMICGFTASYFFGKDVRGRSYFSEEEAVRRCGIISSASLFTKGSFENDHYAVIDSAGIKINVIQNHITFNGRNYSLNSLMNKNIEHFSFFDHLQDSLRKRNLKILLAGNQKDSIRQLFQRFLTISKEHSLKANIDQDKWLALVFDYPDFEQRYIVGNSWQDYNDALSEYAVIEAGNEQAKDSLNQYWKIIDGQEVAFNKYFVPMNQLKYGYGKVADSYRNPNVDSGFLLVLGYFAISCSLLIFSFRVTSGRSWLIALVAMGILNMVFGLFTVMFRFGSTYQALLLLLFLGLLVYFWLIGKRKTEKGVSGMVLNGILWLAPAFVPLLHNLIIAIMKLSSGYYQIANFTEEREKFPVIHMLEENTELVFYLNIVFIFLAMLLLSLKAKKWKGIAEG